MCLERKRQGEGPTGQACLWCMEAQAEPCEPIKFSLDSPNPEQAEAMARLRDVIVEEGEATRTVIYQSAMGLLGGMVAAMANDGEDDRLKGAIAKRAFLRSYVHGGTYYRMDPEEALDSQTDIIEDMRVQAASLGLGDPLEELMLPLYNREMSTDSVAV
jgi:hypothetical protein